MLFDAPCLPAAPGLYLSIPGTGLAMDRPHRQPRLRDLSIEEALHRACISCRQRRAQTVISNKALCAHCAKAEYASTRGFEVRCCALSGGGAKPAAARE